MKYNNVLRVDKTLSVKVADFGLTRDIYETNYYRQQHRTRIPVKWMAPESLIDRISNQKTDVVRNGLIWWGGGELSIWVWVCIIRSLRAPLIVLDL